MKSFIPNLPYSNDTTSRDAAESMADAAETQRRDVYEHIRGCGTEGATCAEVEAALELPHQSASARIWELHHKLKRIRDSGNVRKTPSGRNAIVYVLAQRPLNAAELSWFE